MREEEGAKGVVLFLVGGEDAGGREGEKGGSASHANSRYGSSCCSAANTLSNAGDEHPDPEQELLPAAEY